MRPLSLHMQLAILEMANLNCSHARGAILLGSISVDCLVAFLGGLISVAVLWLIISSATAAGIRRAAQQDGTPPAPKKEDEIPFLIVGKNLSGAELRIRIVAASRASAAERARSLGVAKLKSVERIIE
jgi:hypothetical protein